MAHKMLLKRLILSLLITIIFPYMCLAQSYEQQIDSLLDLIQDETNDTTKLEQYLALSNKQMYSEPTQAMETCYEGLVVSKKMQLHKITSAFYTQLFNIHYYYGSSADTLLKYAKTLHEHTLKNREEKHLVNTYWLYALYYSNTKQDDKELESFFKALEIHRKNSTNEEIESALLGCLGEVLIHQNKHSEAIDYINKALDLTNDDIAKGVNYLNLGDIYTHFEQYDSAQYFYQLSYDFQKKGGDFKGMALALISQGSYFDLNNQFERSNQLYTEALELINENDIGTLLPYIYTTLSEHYQKRKNYSVAIDYGEKALFESNKQQNYDYLAQTYKVQQDNYAAIGAYEKAFEIRGEYMAFKDSVGSTDLLTKVEALKTEYEVEQTETENRLLKAETAADKRAIQNRNIAGLALLLVLLLIGSWAFVVYRSNRQKQKYNEELEVTVAERTEELQQANKTLEQKNYELKTFNYIASHDIKEPIRNIGNYAGLVFQKLPNELKQDFEAYFSTIKNSSNQLYTLVEDFAKYTQLSENANVETQSVDLNEIIESLTFSLNSLIKEQNGRIINEGLPIIQSNTSLIYTILKNIIENGLKFNKSAVPTVSISATEDEQYYQIHIKDNGIGIKEEYHAQVFEMFKRLHTRNEYKGSGIGLAIVKLLTDKLEITLGLRSQSGQGTTFILSIPKMN